MLFLDFLPIFYFLTENGPKWLKMGPKCPQKYFLRFFIKLCILMNFWWFFQIFWTIFDHSWFFGPKIAQNGSKKVQKIFFHIFYQIMYFYEFLVIFSDFLDHFWPFLIFGTQNEPKWLRMGPKRPKKYFFTFFIKLCIFMNFWWFFQIFWTIFDHSWFLCPWDQLLPPPLGLKIEIGQNKKKHPQGLS